MMKYRVTGIIKKQVETIVEADNEQEARINGEQQLKQEHIDYFISDPVAENLDISKIEVIDP